MRLTANRIILILPDIMLNIVKISTYYLRTRICVCVYARVCVVTTYPQHDSLILARVSTVFSYCSPGKLLMTMPLWHATLHVATIDTPGY